MIVTPRIGLNAPFGARCFLAIQETAWAEHEQLRLNAPFGARCFLADVKRAWRGRKTGVLLHLLALGAF